MKVTREQIIKIIRESILSELQVNDPDFSMGATPSQAWSSADVSGSPALLAEIILGLTPAGIAIDSYYMYKALVAKDPELLGLAAVGFIPGIGDLKKLTKADLDKVANELGEEGMAQLRRQADDAAQAASRVSRTARISEPVIETLDDGSLLKAKYTVDIDDMSYDVTFARKSHDAPIDISFNVSGYTRYVTTDAGHPLSLVSGVMDTFKDLHRRYPDEKSFQFTGFISKKDRSNFEMGGDQVSKRTKAFKALIQRALRRDSSIEVEKISDLGWAGDPNTIKITLKELKRIIKELI